MRGSSVNDICKICELDHDRVREACRRSLLTTARILCGYVKGSEHTKEPSARFHGRICDWYQKKQAANHREIAIIIFRNALKSSMFTVAETIRKLITDPNRRILIVSASSDLPTKWIKQMESLIRADDETHGFRHYFPDLVPEKPETWNASEFTINRRGIYAQPSVQAMGVGTSMTGGKYTDIILDDIINRQTSGSPEKMAETISFYGEVRRLFADPASGNLLIPMTLWPGGLYEGILRDEHIQKLIIGCYKDSRWAEFSGEVADGSPVWPEGAPKSFLDREYNRSIYEFSHQYLNVITDVGMQRFESGDMMYYYPDATYDRLAFETDRGPGFVLKEDLSVQMTIDPSTGEGDDESAIIVSAWHKETSRAFVLEAWSGRVLPEGLTNRIFEIYAKWELLGLKPLGVAIEEQGFQKTYKHWLRNESMRRGVHLPIRDDIRPESRSKSSRIVDGLQPFVKRHQVYFTKEHLRLVRQLVDYHPGRLDQRDDLVDALAYQVRFWSYAPREAYRDEFAEVPIHDEDQSDERWYGLECAA